MDGNSPTSNLIPEELDTAYVTLINLQYLLLTKTLIQGRKVNEGEVTFAVQGVGAEEWTLGCEKPAF